MNPNTPPDGTLDWRTVQAILGASLPLADRGKFYRPSMMAQGRTFGMVQFEEVKKEEPWTR